MRTISSTAPEGHGTVPWSLFQALLSSPLVHSRFESTTSVFVSPRPREELRKEKEKEVYAKSKPGIQWNDSNASWSPPNHEFYIRSNGTRRSFITGKRIKQFFTIVGYPPWARCSSCCNFHLGRDLHHRSGHPRRHRSAPFHEAEGLSAVLIL